MPVNSRGNYQYTEADTGATASELLNKQTTALNAKLNIAAGSVSGVEVTPSAYAYRTVTFPPGMFTSPPKVLLSAGDAPPARYRDTVMQAVSVTATGFSIRTYGFGTGTYSDLVVNWVAAG